MIVYWLVLVRSAKHNKNDNSPPPRSPPKVGVRTMHDYTGAYRQRSNMILFFLARCVLSVGQLVHYNVTHGITHTTTLALAVAVVGEVGGTI